MNYVVACVTLFNSGANEIVLRARGQAISKAVDTAELLRKAFVKDLTVKSVNIGTENVARPDGTKVDVSIMEIVLSRK
jgi:DNA-binding protein